MRARGPMLVALLALVAAVAAGGCQQVVQWEPPDNGDAGDGGDDAGQDGGDGGVDGGVDGGGNLGDGGTGAWIFSFGPNGQFLRAPADGGFTTPNRLTITILRGGESGAVQVAFSSADASVAAVPGGSVTIQPGAVTADVPLDSTAAGDTILTATFDGGQLQTMVHVLPTIVISEVAAKTDNDDNDELVELYNPTAVNFPLGGYELQYHSNNTSAQYLSVVTLDGGMHIAPHGFFLIGINGYNRSEDAHSSWPSGALSTNPGTVRLGAPGIGLNVSEPLAVDTVGWGNNAVGPEGSPVDVTLLGIWGSIERKAKATSNSSSMLGGADDRAGNAYDTGDNSQDFVIHTGIIAVQTGLSVQNPQTSTAQPETPP